MICINKPNWALKWRNCSSGLNGPVCEGMILTNHSSQTYTRKGHVTVVLAALAMEIVLDSICTVSSNFYPLQTTTNPKACLVQSKEVSLKSQRCQILLREEWDALNL